VKAARRKQIEGGGDVREVKYYGGRKRSSFRRKSSIEARRNTLRPVGEKVQRGTSIKEVTDRKGIQKVCNKKKVKRERKSETAGTGVRQGEGILSSCNLTKNGGGEKEKKTTEDKEKSRKTRRGDPQAHLS